MILPNVLTTCSAFPKNFIVNYIVIVDKEFLTCTSKYINDCSVDPDHVTFTSIETHATEYSQYDRRAIRLRTLR